jgi:mono/diheme cytochrome c family protein
LPRGAAHDAQRGVLWVVCRGDDSLIGFRDDRFAREVARVRIGGGPRGVALDPARARLVTWSEFAQQLWVASLPDGMGRDGTEVAAKAIAIEGLATLAPQLALGRRLFHLAGATRRLASDGRACASCHPDGRDDGLTWATSEGPRQTPVLSARLGDAAPFGWDGANDTLDTHLVRTLRRLSGTGLEPHEREAILAYVQSMRAPMVDPSGDAAFVEGGAAVFAEMGCASCHPKGGSDGLAHDIGSRSQHDPTLRYDTPSLRFVARSAPYFHDGRYPTIEALLSDASSGMGDSARLSEPDRRALAAYLRSL